MRRRLRLLLALLTALCAAGLALGAGKGSGPGSAGRSGKKKSAASDAVAAGDQFPGLFVPLNATDLHAPEGGFRISGWSSWHGQLKLLDLLPDGREVKKGEVIARFEFNGRDALRWVQDRQQRAVADREQARISTEQTLDGLRVDQRRRQLEAKLAALDVQRERAISRRQADLYRIAEKIALFEADAVTQRLGSGQRARSAELAFHDQNVARMEQDLERYKLFEGRFSVVAPHDGVVRHAYNPRERRKVQKGDSIQAGQKLVAVAKDAALAVRFFVPEHRVFEVAEGAEVTVVSSGSGEERQAVVKRLDFFPQELGFLRELPTLPNAREKAFAVTAELNGEVGTLSAGTEVRVKGKGR
jgi:biotin carboxyl carrier protein